MFDGPSFAQGTIVGGGDVRAVSYGEDKGLFVEFRSEPFYNEFQSKSQGKAIYDNKVMVKIYTPGDKTKIVDRLARLEDEDGFPADSRRWPQQWAAFQEGRKAEVEGTPLGMWPMINSAQVRELNAINIYTVEQLAEVNDSILDNIGLGARSLRDGAITFIRHAQEEGAFAKMEARNNDLQRQLDELRASMGEDAKRGPGRPKKEQNDVI